MPEPAANHHHQPGASPRRLIALSEGRPEIVDDRWQDLDDDQPRPEGQAVIVSQARYAREVADGWLGLVLPGETDPEALVAAIGPLAEIPLIAIVVPKFTDGRHYSLARMLRERYGFTGALRVRGDVVPDQLFYMRRCGYTSFELAARHPLETGVRTLTAFSVSYQGGADDPRPLYRRR